MTPEQRVDAIAALGMEILTRDELIARFQEADSQGRRLLAYDGFEPSGNIHIAQGLLRAITVNRMSALGVDYIFWVADWFALMNNKLGGDLEKINAVGEYFVEVWKACGMDLAHVRFEKSSERMDQEYWLRTIRIGMANSLDRVKRCGQIMGRAESDNLSAAQIFYPTMQASDIFELEVDIAQLGMDQRKVNVLARETAEKIGKRKPIAIHHHMLMGLQHVAAEGLTGADAAIAKKMSKSNPDSSIFMNDSTEDIARKFKKAFCPEKQIEDNPILEYCKHIVFQRDALSRNADISITIERPEKFGGNRTFQNYLELEQAYAAGEVHPMDLKVVTAKHIDALLEPVRRHFVSDVRAKQLADTVTSYSVTR